MKRHLFLIILSFIITIAYGQLSEGGKPYGFNNQGFKSTEQINNKTLRRINIDRAQRLDKRRGVENRYSIYRNVNWDIKKLGTQQKVETGTLWHFNIQSKNGYSLGIIFDEFHLPKGAKLFIYSSDMSIVKGAFSHQNNKSHKQLAIAEIPAKNIIIEYFEPDNIEFEGRLVIGKIGQSYKDIFKSTSSNSHIDKNE